jgi:hypothetical protein
MAVTMEPLYFLSRVKQEVRYEISAAAEAQPELVNLRRHYYGTGTENRKDLGP